MANANEKRRDVLYYANSLSPHQDPLGMRQEHRDRGL